MNKEGIHIEDANVSGERITQENKAEYHFIIDQIEESILTRLYEDEAATYRDRWLAEYYNEMEMVFDEMIAKYPDDLFAKFITDRQGLAVEMYERLMEIHGEHDRDRLSEKAVPELSNI